MPMGENSGKLKPSELALRFYGLDRVNIKARGHQRISEKSYIPLDVYVLGVYYKGVVSDTTLRPWQVKPMAQDYFSVAQERAANGETGERIRIKGHYLLHGQIGMSVAGEALADSEAADAELIADVQQRLANNGAANTQDPYWSALRKWLEASQSVGIFRARNRQGNWYAPLSREALREAHRREGERELPK
jgi:hypothetical protein